MTNKPTETLQDLIQIARDSRSFYESAIGKLPDGPIRMQFKRMLDAKTAMIDSLSLHVAARGEQPERTGTLAGGLRKAYGEALAAIGGKDSAASTYTAQLEQTEDRLLHAFEDALATEASGPVRDVLIAQLPKLRDTHEEMRRLKLSQAA